MDPNHAIKMPQHNKATGYAFVMFLHSFIQVFPLISHPHVHIYLYIHVHLLFTTQSVYITVIHYITTIHQSTSVLYFIFYFILFYIQYITFHSYILTFTLVTSWSRGVGMQQKEWTESKKVGATMRRLFLHTVMLIFTKCREAWLWGESKAQNNKQNKTICPTRFYLNLNQTKPKTFTKPNSLN